MGPHPADTVAREIASLKQRGATLLVLLHHLNQDERDKVIKRNPEINFALGGQDMRMAHGVARVGSSLACDAYMRGKSLSVLDIYIKNGSLSFVDQNARKALIQRKTNLERQLKGNEDLIDRWKKDPDKAKQLGYMEKNVVRLKTEIKEVSLNLKEAVAPNLSGSYISWLLKSMDKTIADEKLVLAMVNAYRKKYPDPSKRRTVTPPKPALKPTKGNSRTR